jgi:hypothetical protein
MTAAGAVEEAAVSEVVAEVVVVVPTPKQLPRGALLPNLKLHLLQTKNNNQENLPAPKNILSTICHQRGSSSPPGSAYLLAATQDNNVIPGSQVDGTTPLCNIELSPS